MPYKGVGSLHVCTVTFSVMAACQNHESNPLCTTISSTEKGLSPKRLANQLISDTFKSPQPHI